MESYKISSGPLTAKVLSYGAILQDLRLEGVDFPLVLGHENGADYQNHAAYFGATVGRFANRIAGGRLEIDGQSYELDRNYDGRFTLHGGQQGFANQVWTLENLTASSVSLTLRSADGEMGFPGTMKVRCLYELEGETLRITLTATTDKPNVCSLTNHSYFNLDNQPTIVGHKLLIQADARLDGDADSLPNGGLLAVAGTRDDFRQLRPINAFDEGAYDANYCLSACRDRALSHAATLVGSDDRIRLETWTNQPGLVVYTGDKLDISSPGLEGRRYGTFAGIALETGAWPDAPTYRHFPSAILRPGETYTNLTEYRFSL